MRIPSRLRPRITLRTAFAWTVVMAALLAWFVPGDEELTPDLMFTSPAQTHRVRLTVHHRSVIDNVDRILVPEGTRVVVVDGDGDSAVDMKFHSRLRGRLTFICAELRPIRPGFFGDFNSYQLAVRRDARVVLLPEAGVWLIDAIILLLIASAAWGGIAWCRRPAATDSRPASTTARTVPPH